MEIPVCTESIEEADQEREKEMTALHNSGPACATRYKTASRIVLLFSTLALTLIALPAFAQLEGDGTVDIAFAGFSSSAVCLGDGIGGFGCTPAPVNIDVGQGVALGDFDKDGTVDMVFARAVRCRDLPR